MLGHSETSTTLNIYAHEVAAANARAVDVVGDIYNELLGKKKGWEGMFIAVHRRNEQDNEHLRANEAPHKKREPTNA